MRIAFSLLAITGLFVLPGCEAPELTVNELKQLDLVELCQVYSTSKDIGWTKRAAQSKSELVRRKSLSKQDIEDIDGGLIRTGQKEHVLVCSWGPYKSKNVTAGTFGRHVQYVFGDFGPYGYTENGRVTSWQQSY